MLKIRIKKGNYIEYLLPFFLLLSQYKIIGIPISTLFLFVIAILTYFKYGFRLQKYLVPFLIFFAYAVFHDLLSLIIGYSDQSTTLHKIIEYSVNFILMIVIVAGSELNENKLFSIWKKAGIFYFVGCLYHLFKIYILKQPVQIIQILPWIEVINTNEAFRPRSFFQEPSYLAESVLPLLFLALKRKDYKWAVFSTAIIVFSTSSIGIALAIVLWGSSYILDCKEENRKRNPFVLIILIAFFSFFASSGVIADSFYKFQDALKGGSTFSVRVTLGFLVVRNLTIPNILLGSFFNEVSDYIRMNQSLLYIPMIYKYWAMGNEFIFLNAFCTVIFRYGLVGLILFLRTYKGTIFNKKYGARVYALMSFVGLFANVYILNAPYFVITIIMLLYMKKAKSELIIKNKGM